MESKQRVLESGKKELGEAKELLERGKREAAAEADKLDERKEVGCSRRSWCTFTSILRAL